MQTIKQNKAFYFFEMEETQRLKELLDYKILDTPPEKELDDLANIASLACGVPISLLTLVDDKRQWFKSKKGLSVSETLREDSFCQHALHNPDEILVVNDSWEDDRFKDNVLVLSDPHIRFYAGAPLVTPTGNVLGTLCVIDREPRELTDDQKSILKILSEKAINYLNTRKLILEQKENIETNLTKIKKLTNQAPGVIYQLRMTEQGQMNFDFISEGISRLHPTLNPKQLRKNAEIAFEVVHQDDLSLLTESLQTSFHKLTDWSVEYRVIHGDQVNWHLGTGRPERLKNNDVIWYGTFQDITPQKEYEKAMEQIAFDISHVLRRPITSMLGLTNLIDKEDIDEINFKEFSGHIKLVSQELDSFSKKLNDYYMAKWDKIEKSNSLS